MRTGRVISNVPLALGDQWIVAPEYEWRVCLSRAERDTLRRAVTILAEMRERGGGADDPDYDALAVSLAEVWVSEVLGGEGIP